MIWASRERERQGLHLQLRSAEGRQRRHPGALRLDVAAVHRRRAPEGPRRQEAAPDPEAGSAARARDPVERRGPTIWCSTRSAAPAPPAPSPSGSAAASSASSGTPKYAKAAEKRIAATKPLEAPTLAPFVTAREAPRVPFSALIERGLVSPGARLVDAKKRHKALVRADGAVSLGEPSARSTVSARWRRASTPATAGPSGMSRRRRASPDRRVPRPGARRNGGSRRIDLQVSAAKLAEHAKHPDFGFWKLRRQARAKLSPVSACRNVSTSRQP